MSITLGGTPLECGKDPYIIAAIDNNWNTEQDLLESINQAKSVGADAVKLMMYNYDVLYGIPKDKKSAYDASRELAEEVLPKLKSQCDRMGIHFMVSVFDADHVRVVDPYVLSHHITSSEINHVPLLKELARIRKPVFMHVGCASSTEIIFALSHLESTPVILMYGVDSQPEPASNVDLTLLEQLKAISHLVGFFDTTLDTIYLPYAATKFHKACVIEKHLNVVKGVTPDYKFSIGVSEFKTMVERIRGAGRGYLGRNVAENNLLRKAKRRLIATSSIKSGEVLKFNKNYGMFSTPKSDSQGLFAIDYMDIDGKLAAKDIEVGEPIGKGYFVE